MGRLQPPPTHFSPALQPWQVAPPMPHAVSEVPETQALPEQHPAQEPGEQDVLGTQNPATHFSPDMHTLHWAPLVPHAVTLVPEKHCPLAQHPLGQVQPPLEHCPLRQTWGSTQRWHRLPPLPQFSLDMASMQAPFLVQQPPQLKGPHRPPSWLPIFPSWNPGPTSSSEHPARAKQTTATHKTLRILTTSPPL